MSIINWHIAKKWKLPLIFLHGRYYLPLLLFFNTHTRQAVISFTARKNKDFFINFLAFFLSNIFANYMQHKRQYSLLSYILTNSHTTHADKACTDGKKTKKIFCNTM